MSVDLRGAGIALCVYGGLLGSAYAQYGQYIGTMTTVFEESGAPTGYRVSNSVLVSIQEPYQIPAKLGPTTGTGDTNPVFLFVSDRAVNLQTGALHIVSATPQIGGGSTAQPPGLWVMQSWKLHMTANGFTGTFDSPAPIDYDNGFVSLEDGFPCMAFLSRVTNLTALFDTANKSILLTVIGHGGGELKGECLSDVSFHSNIAATLDPSVAPPQPSLTASSAVE